MHASKAHRSLLLALVFTLGSCGINNIPILEQAVNDAWVEVQEHYRKRAELVMQLLELVEPLEQMEPALFEEVKAAETRLFEMHVGPDTLEDKSAFVDFQERQESMSLALQKLLNEAKDYQHLANTKEFIAIDEQLADNGKLIDVGKRAYWQNVERFNTELINVPGRWWRAFVYPKAVKKENFPEPPEERTLTGQDS